MPKLIKSRYDQGLGFYRSGLIAGFADGVIADIRTIAAQRRGQTA